MPPHDLSLDAPVPDREHMLLAREARDFVLRTRRDNRRVYGLQGALLIAFLLAWWAGSGTVVDRLFVSDPVSVATAWFKIVADGTLWWHLERTLIAMSLGYVVGVTVGIGLAIAVSKVPWGEEIVRPLMVGLFAVPKVALAPLIIVWFGIFLLPKIVLSALLVVFIVYFNTVAGIASIGPGILATVRVMGASRIALFTKLILPNAAPYIFTAMRITAPGALIGAIIVEFVSSNRGIGFLIAAASSRYDTARVFAGIGSLLIFVLLLNTAVSRLERHVARWRPDQAGTQATA
jgi:NitT/TauT family transport system permease protein